MKKVPQYSFLSHLSLKGWNLKNNMLHFIGIINTPIMNTNFYILIISRVMRDYYDFKNSLQFLLKKWKNLLKIIIYE